MRPRQGYTTRAGWPVKDGRLRRRHQATAKAIYEALLSKGVLRNDIVYITVKIYLERLIQKGYVTARTLGDPRGTYLYTATLSRQEICDHPDLLERIINAL